MCTVIASVGVWDDVPLVVAANRDERLDRPAAPPDLRTHRGRRLVAPLDLQAGGTWLAIGHSGVLAAITNRHDPAYFGRVAARSRGAIVLDAAIADDAESAARAAGALDPDEHNPFHLLIADRTTAHVVWSDGRTVRRHGLAPGLHVITEQSFDAPRNRLRLSSRGAIDADGRERFVAALLAEHAIAAEPSPPSPAVWRAILSRHGEGDPFAGTCVHGDAFGYGTRASTLVVLGTDSSGDALLHAEGRPCTTALTDRSELLAALHATRRNSVSS